MAWEGLLSIIREARDIALAEESRAPAACPECGTPLIDNPNGGLYCPFTDHYFWN